MTQIDKLAGMFYEINKNKIEIDVVATYKDSPDQHIRQCIYTVNPNFWNFVFHAVIEAKQGYLDIVDNYDGEASRDEIANAKVMIEKLREVEKSLSVLVTGARKDYSH